MSLLPVDDVNKVIVMDNSGQDSVTVFASPTIVRSGVGSEDQLAHGSSSFTITFNLTNHPTESAVARKAHLIKKKPQDDQDKNKTRTERETGKLAASTKMAIAAVLAHEDKEHSGSSSASETSACPGHRSNTGKVRADFDNESDWLYYRKRRERNNISSSESRKRKRNQVESAFDRLESLVKENERLQLKINAMTNELDFLHSVMVRFSQPNNLVHPVPLAPLAINK